MTYTDREANARPQSAEPQRDEGGELVARPKPQLGRFADVGQYGWGDMEPEQALETFHWFHVPKEGGWVVVVLSTQPFHYEGHFIGRQMHPHRVPHCAYCQAGLARQPRWCFSVLDVETGERGIIEVSAVTVRQIAPLAKERGELRGLPLTLGKVGRRLNGDITAEKCSRWLEEIELPPEQDPAVLLNGQWAKQALKQAKKDGAPRSVVSDPNRQSDSSRPGFEAFRDAARDARSKQA